ncbi:unnamed protein product [Brassica oleracea var. botrytis]|uniref:BnaCnng13570D protein n=3 Tax=Brassica TaxID=3705 RepID=A0A078I975_BRANA|nr:hypothetical protein HID58_071598 [Brassica napus]CAF2059814.1 unnamed protein product [Brassica napus]CAF2059816.1 unnamed protein product [Brassica napus]CDY45692.1 BnaCnng13570D [Brassica napus]CDY45693.1 BnaCnng13580D [Brassica napus]
MAKTTILAIFMVVLVLGTVMESQGQEMCTDYSKGSVDCQAKPCNDQCVAKYNGHGRCLHTMCVCTYICKT